MSRAGSSPFAPITKRWRLVHLGLLFKKLGLGLLLCSMFASVWIVMSQTKSAPAWIVGLAVATLAVDLIGRSLCLAAPVAKRWHIRISVAAQATGLIFVCIASAMIWPGGIAFGILVAAVCQIAAARWFVAFLEDVASYLNRPELSDEIGRLRDKLNAFTFSAYGAMLITVVTTVVSLALGFLMFGIGLFVTIPMGLMVIAFALMYCLFFYLNMVYVYQRVIRDVDNAVQAVATAASSDPIGNG